MEVRFRQVSLNMNASFMTKTTSKEHINCFYTRKNIETKMTKWQANLHLRRIFKYKFFVIFLFLSPQAFNRNSTNKWKMSDISYGHRKALDICRKTRQKKKKYIGFSTSNSTPRSWISSIIKPTTSSLPALMASVKASLSLKIKQNHSFVFVFAKQSYRGVSKSNSICFRNNFIISIWPEAHPDRTSFFTLTN